MKRRQVLALAGLPGAFNSHAAAAPRRIGVTPGPHAEILDQVAVVAAQTGLILQVIVREGGQGINDDLAVGRLDAASFQDGVAFAAESLQRQGRLVSVASTITLPMALYARRLASPRQLRDGDAVALPADPANLARALVLLQNFGLIELRVGSGLHAGLRDVVGNRRRLHFRLLADAALPEALPEAALVVMGSAAAARVGLEPARDAIGIEDARTPYAGVLVVRREQADAAWVSSLLQAYRSEPVKRFVLERYRDSVRRPW